jgi:hypothetical protein
MTPTNMTPTIMTMILVIDQCRESGQRQRRCSTLHG